MKSMIMSVPGLLLSFWLVVSKMTGLQEMLPNGIAKGAVMFVMVIAMGVAIYEIIDLFVNGLVSEKGVPGYMASQKRTLIISIVVIVAILFVGFVLPVIL